MKKDETLQQYFLHMKECALHGKIEDAALIEYVIDGIADSEYHKSILYGASNIKEFRQKLNIYQHIKEKVQERPSTSAQPFKNNNVKRCFNCGDLDHQAPVCTKGIKCFKCNEFGHKGIDCSIKKTLNIRNNKMIIIDKEDKEVKSPYKKIKINDVETIALVDTGSDVNLIKLTEAEKVRTEKSKYDEEAKIQLSGIARKELITEGILNTNVMIDNYNVDINFHVVKDYDIPVNVILGNPILKDFEVNFTANGIFIKKIIKDRFSLPLVEDSLDSLKDAKTLEYNEIEDRSESRIKHADALSRSPQCMTLTETAARPKRVQDDDSRGQDQVIERERVSKEKVDMKLVVVPKKMQKEVIRKKHEIRRFGTKMRYQSDEIIKMIKN